VTYKILIDSRRKINSGIGRVSQWLSKNITFDKQEYEVINLAASNTCSDDYDFHENQVIRTGIKPFSYEEYYELPKLVESIKPDLYVNPQTTWSPLHTIPSVNIIHDLWAIKNPEWLPTKSDLEARFGLKDTAYFDSLYQWFSKDRAMTLLTEYGYEEWCKAKLNGNIIWLGCWAQYAATVSMSKSCVVVSDYIKEEVEKYFQLGVNSKVIHNMPNSFGANSYRTDKTTHFLTLSKLENRKNLDYLLDSYKEYCHKTKIPLPLIIAGDPGYASVAERLLNKISKMNDAGYSVVFKKSVSDSELEKLFTDSCALIFPTHFEGFGLPALEGMMSRIPVIATKTGMMSTHLGQHAAIINGKDIQELADKMVLSQKGTLCVCVKAAECSVRDFVETCDSQSKWKSVIHEIHRNHAQQSHALGQ